MERCLETYVRSNYRERGCILWRKILRGGVCALKITVLVNRDSNSAIYIAIYEDAKYLMSESLYMCCLFCSFTERAAERPAAKAWRWGRGGCMENMGVCNYRGCFDKAHRCQSSRNHLKSLVNTEVFSMLPNFNHAWFCCSHWLFRSRTK